MPSSPRGGAPARKALRPQVAAGLAGLPDQARNAATRRATPQDPPEPVTAPSADRPADGERASGGRPPEVRGAGKRRGRKPRSVPDPFGESKADMAAWAARTYRALWRVEGSAYWREDWTRPELAEALEAVRREVGLWGRLARLEIRDGRAIPPSGWSLSAGVRLGSDRPVNPPLVRSARQMTSMVGRPGRTRRPFHPNVWHLDGRWLLGFWPVRTRSEGKRLPAPHRPRSRHALSLVARYARWRTGQEYARPFWDRVKETQTWHQLLEVAGVAEEVAEKDRRRRLWDTPREAFLLATGSRWRYRWTCGP